jgi:hypothetical protein
MANMSYCRFQNMVVEAGNEILSNMDFGEGE